MLLVAKRLEALDVRLARDTYLQAWWAAILAGKFAAPGGTLAEVCRAVRAAPQPATRQPCDLLLDGLATGVIEGRVAAVSDLRAAVDLFLADRASEDDWIQSGRSVTGAALALWDAESHTELSARQVAKFRESGALLPLALALNHQIIALTWRGNLDSAEALVAEQYGVSEITGIPMASSGALLLAGYKGRPAELAALEDEVQSEDILALEMCNLASAVLNIGLGRYRDALQAAGGVTIFTLSSFALPERVEAAILLGRPDDAGDALAQLSGAVVPGSDWAEGLEARCRALLETGDKAELSYAEAIDRLARTPLRLDLARAHLLYGEWLRRAHRNGEARKQLRGAYELFVDSGAEAFAERTRRELAAAGERLVKLEVATRHELNDKELRIARLAREGRTNVEIGAELFLSPRTIEWHLRRIFVKLGITSRTGLQDALPPLPGSGSPRSGSAPSQAGDTRVR